MARLWPTYPYAIYNGLPFLLFMVMTCLPALAALAETVFRRQPPSRPLVGS